MLTVYPDRLRRDIAAAVANATSGSKIPAGNAVVQSAFPAGMSLVLLRDDVAIFTTTLQALQVSAGKLKLGKVYGATSVFTSGDIDTGTWKVRIVMGTAYMEGVLTKTGGSGPFFLTADAAPALGLSIGDVYLALDQTLDPPSGGGGGTGSQADTLNRVVLGMTGSSDLTPTGLSGGWSQGGVVVMGTKPQGAAIPSWYGYPSVMALTDWQRLQFWWYVNITSQTNRGGNFRIQIRNQIVQIKRISTGAWTEYGRESGGGADYYGASGSGLPESPAVRRTAISGGGDEYKLSSNTNHVNIHGYGPNVNISAIVSDISNIALSLECRLVLDNASGTDDRSSANLVMNVGGDYYPTTNASTASLGVAYFPGIGSCRFTKITNDWQMMMMSPLANAREVDNTSSISGANKTVSEASFRALPPSFSLLV